MKQRNRRAGAVWGIVKTLVSPIYYLLKVIYMMLIGFYGAIRYGYFSAYRSAVREKFSTDSIYNSHKDYPVKELEEKIDGRWLCSCRTMNIDEDKVCRKCRMDRKLL